MSNNFKDHIHWEGNKNLLIRYYFYINTGLNVFNNFKYLVAGIFGLYLMLHMKNPWLLLIMSGVSVPILFIIGYYSIHHINKVQDWLSVKFGTTYAIYNIELLESIRDELKKLNKGKGDE